MTENEKAGAVGYNHPPRQRQFRPGESENPSGQLEGLRNFKSELRAELSELVTVQDGERNIQISKQRALIKSLVAAGIKGNQRAAESVLAMCVRLLADAEDESIESVADEEIVDAFTKRKKRAATVGVK